MFSLPLPNQNKVDPRRAKEASSIRSIAIEYENLMHDCFPKLLRMRTARRILERDSQKEADKIR